MNGADAWHRDVRAKKNGAEKSAPFSGMACQILPNRAAVRGTA
jgi:hypothetical protein